MGKRAFRLWKKKTSIYFIALFNDLEPFFKDLLTYTMSHLRLSFFHIENGKFIFVNTLYQKRGKHARKFVHSGMAGLTALGIMIAPVIANEFPGTTVDPWAAPSPSSVLSASTDNESIQTLFSDKIRDKIIKYSVQDGDTISSIAEKFGVSKDTILWQNDLTEKSTIKQGQELQILPVSGVAHSVKKGDTIYSIGKKYDVDAQAIVSFPFNTFSNDETFELAIGQVIIVPEGVMPQKTQQSAPSPRYKLITPDAGTVVASGSFAWPTSGSISQGYAWYHPGVDIANRAAPDVLAADAGTIVVAGWPDNWGYGNRVVIDHGNGYRTLYAHLSSIYVKAGQTVSRGSAVGKMGTTGRSTGIHLHFEVIKGGNQLNPLTVLK